MKRSIERSELSTHLHEADALFDTLGFSGEYRAYDEVDAMIAMKDFLLSDNDSNERADDTVRRVIEVCRVLRDNVEYRDDERASAALGWTIGHKTSHATSLSESRALIDRSLQNVRVSRDAIDQGSIEMFYGAFLEAACAEARTAPDTQQKHIRQIVQHTATLQYRLRKQERMQSRAEKPSIWPDFRRGLATIAMVHGYHVQPPPDQRDENGAWQLPHEREDEDDA